MRRYAILVASIASLAWSIHTILNMRVHSDGINFTSLNLTVNELRLLIHLCICGLALWIAIESFIEIVRHRVVPESSFSVPSNRFRALLLGGLVLASHQSSHPPQPLDIPEQGSVPASLFLTPAMATLLINDILRRRREQIRSRKIPDVLTLEETNLLSDVQKIAQYDSRILQTNDLDDSLPIVRELTSAVERTSQIDVVSSMSAEEPLLVIHLYGYPEVRGRDGQSASFKKKRALELVVWLSLNRDRPRRSAARTALWQVDVNDSSFSTIVSDMRRGISDVVTELSRSDLVPTTYSDELILSSRVTTDYELLRHALEEFRGDPSRYGNLMNELKGIRDAPFSGTAYEWADLDGTTTRLIITAMQAALELAEYGKSIGDVEVMSTAVAAGLRVMPGNEELLKIQQSFIPSTQMSRSAKLG